jgi:hypothetical protein
MIFQWRLLLSTNENAVQRRMICRHRWEIWDETTPNEQKQRRKWGLFRSSHIVLSHIVRG